MAKETKYLLVYDTSRPLLDENCTHLGFPLGTTFEQMRGYGAPFNGYDRTKDGSNIWVLPFFVDSSLTFEENPTVYEVLTLEELGAYPFDEIEVEI